MKLLVIGNGFDIDLGVNTTYKEFFERTNYGKDSVVPGSLEDFLYAKYLCSNKLNWFDVEESLAEYVRKKEKPVHHSLIEIDKMQLKNLRNAFYDYIIDNWTNKSINLWKEPTKQSLAKAIIERQNRIKYFEKMYSFNCLDYSMLDIASGLEIESLYDIVFLHGHSSQFIFGIAEEDCICKDYSFLVKKNQPGYPIKDVENFKCDLLKSEEVIIFGHSLNRIDMTYFRQFFLDFAKRSEMDRKITIITKDFTSAKEIKKRISEYVLDFDKVNQYGTISFILTSEYNMYQEFLDRLA